MIYSVKDYNPIFPRGLLGGLEYVKGHDMDAFVDWAGWAGASEGPIQRDLQSAAACNQFGLRAFRLPNAWMVPCQDRRSALRYTVLGSLVPLYARFGHNCVEPDVVRLRKDGRDPARL